MSLPLHCHFCPSQNLGLFPETCTKLNSDFAYDQCTLGLQMDRDVEEGVPLFLQACLGKPGNSWLLYQLQLWLGKNSKPESCQWFHSVHETGLLQVCERDHQYTKVRKSREAIPTVTKASHTQVTLVPAWALGCVLGRVSVEAMLGYITLQGLS